MIPKKQLFECNLDRARWRKAWRQIRLYRKGQVAVTSCEDYNINDMLCAAHCHNMRDRQIKRTLQERLMVKGWMKGWEEHNVSRWN